MICPGDLLYSGRAGGFIIREKGDDRELRSCREKGIAIER